MLELRKAWFRYSPKGHWVLRDASLSLAMGELVHIRGESGGGKTTALKVLNRLLELERGELLWHKQPAAGISVSEYRGQVIYVPQEPFMRQGTVAENLGFPFSFAAHREKPPPSGERIRQLLGSFGLGAVQEKASANDLSVGQMTRLSVVRSLLLKPKVLLLDEPLAGLDEESRRLFEQGIVSAWEEEKMAVVLVSHIPLEHDLKENAMRRLDLKEGRFAPRKD